MSKSKPIFDPIIHRRKRTRRQSIASNLQERAEVFRNDVLSALTEYPDILDDQGCNQLTKELALIVAMGGFQATLLLKDCLQLIPNTYVPKDRMAYVEKILGSAVQVSAPPPTGCLPDLCRFCETLGVRDDATAITLKSLSMTTGTPYTYFIAPPVSTCLHCKQQTLYRHHPPTCVTVFTLDGPLPGIKICLRCKGCGTNYNYSKYGRKKADGETYYAKHRNLIEINDVVYASRKLYNLYCLFSMHCWVSFSGFAEVYFEFCSEMNDNMQWIKTFVDEHSAVSTTELTRKHVSDMFFKGEIEEQLRESGEIDSTIFRNDHDFEEVMHTITERAIIYCHEQSKYCKDRGCGFVWAVDGNWKICFPHCMFPVKATVPGLKGVTFPDVCPEQPKGNSVFCPAHLQVAEERQYPTDLRGFLNFCNIDDSPEDTDELDDHLPTTVVENVNIDLIAKQQGTQALLKEYPQLIEEGNDVVEVVSKCEKNTGRRKKLRHWSRGQLFIVRSCGHIETFRPLFKSESPSQVTIIVLSWLNDKLKEIPPEKWSDVVISYDNMCKVDGLKALQAPLPLPKPFDNMWTTVTKVIDEVHYKNHTDPRCLSKYNPTIAKEKHPNANFVVAEQTFSWLSRFKRILCAMPKNHHMFYLHRICIRRNRYTEKCNKLERRVFLPKSSDTNFIPKK